MFTVLARVTTYLENLEMSRNLNRKDQPEFGATEMY